MHYWSGDQRMASSSVTFVISSTISEEGETTDNGKEECRKRIKDKKEKIYKVKEKKQIRAQQIKHIKGGGGGGRRMRKKRIFCNSVGVERKENK